MNSYIFLKIFKFVFKSAINLVGIILAFFFFIFIKLISPFILIRFSNIISTRLGHFLEDVDIYLSCKKKKLNNSDLKKYRNSIDIFYFRSKVCNKYVAKIIKKKLIIFPYFLMFWVDRINNIFVKFFNLENIHENGAAKNGDYNYPPLLNRDIFGCFNEEANFSFELKEKKKGFEILKRLGINSKYVCIYTRDSKYLSNTYPYNDWSSHDYRDTDIDLMIETTKYLIEKDYYVVRVGKLMEKKMNFSHDKFIDYSFSKFQSDFMDIFIIANSEFFITSSSGIDAVATTFRKDIIFPFLFPVFDTKSSTKNHFVAYKNLYSEKLKRNLTLKEIIKYQYGYIYKKNELVENKLKIINPSEFEICDIVRDYLENSFIGDEALMKKFYDIFSRSNLYHGKYKFHEKNRIKFRISKTFLKKNNNWLN